MTVSVFDIFTPGVGPSSSHTMGPMRAAGRFVERLRSAGRLDRVSRVEVKLYAARVVANARALADTLVRRGLDIVSGGTDSHLMLVDLRPKKLTGKAAEASLERAGMTCNKNGIPFDPEKPMVTSGIRLGTPAGTTRGFDVAEFVQVGELIGDVLDGLAGHPDDNSAAEATARAKVAELCKRFPIYQ